MISVPQGLSGYKAHQRQYGSKVKKSADKMLPNIRHNCGGVIAVVNKQHSHSRQSKTDDDYFKLRSQLI